MSDGASRWQAGALRRRGGLAAAVAAMVAVAAPVLWVVLTRDHRFTGDMALIELRVRDVLSAHPPVAGAYSRYGWAHPGPWQFYLFAVPYRLLGGDARAMQLTTLGFNLVVAAVTIWLAARQSRATAIVTGVALLVMVAGLQPQSIAYGWNVTVTVLPFVLVVVGCWRIIDSDRWALPITTAAVLFVCQAHVGVGVVILPLFLAVVAVAGVGTLRSRRNGADTDGDARAWGVSAVVAVVAMLPLGYDIVADPPGNIGRLARWSLTNDEPQVGLGDSLRLVGRSSSLSFLADPQLPGRFLLELGRVDPGVLPGLSIALLLASLIIAHRRRWSRERNSCATVAALWGLAVVAAALITQPLGWWLVQWLQPLGWLTWVAIVLVAWRLISERVPVDSRATASQWSLVIAVIVSVVAIVDHGRDAVAWPDPAAEFTRPVDELTAALAETVDGRRVRLEFAGESLLAETMLSGVVTRLAALGEEVCIEQRLAYKLGERRVCPPEVDASFLLRFEPRSLPAPPGMSQVADVDPLTPSERVEADALTDAIAAILERTGRADQVSILDTALADVILLNDPPAELVAVSDDIARLDELREVPGDRYVLYGTD